MFITWHGLSCFEITAKTSKGEVTILIDPYDNETGLRFPRTLEAPLVLSSHDEKDANNISAVGGHPFIVNGPGEFEVKDVFVYSISARTKGDEKTNGMENLLFRIEAEDMRLAHLGAIDRPLTDDELSQLENIDILMLPVGGGRVLSPKTAAEVLGEIEPRIVIPMTHAIENIKEKLAVVEDFCKALGACKSERMQKYKITRKDLPEEDMMMVILDR